MSRTDISTTLPAGCDRPLPAAVQWFLVPAAVAGFAVAGALVLLGPLGPSQTWVRGLGAALWIVATAVHMLRTSPRRRIDRRGVAAGVVLGAAAAAFLLAGAA